MRKRWTVADEMLEMMKWWTPTFSFDIFIDNYFTSFRPLTHLGVKNIQQNAEMHYHWGQTAARERKVATLNSAHYPKKQWKFD